MDSMPPSGLGLEMNMGHYGHSISEVCMVNTVAKGKPDFFKFSVVFEELNPKLYRHVKGNYKVQR